MRIREQFTTYNHVCESLRLRLGVQVVLDNFERDQIQLRLTPQISLAHNSKAIFAIGFEWLFGSLNFYVISKLYAEQIASRRSRVKEEAEKMNLTKRQVELRWGW